MNRPAPPREPDAPPSRPSPSATAGLPETSEGRRGAPNASWRNTLAGALFGHPRYWCCQILAWLGYGVFSCTAVLSNRPSSFVGGFVVATVVACLLGLAFSHALRACSVAGRWTRLGWGALLLRVLPLALLYGAACGWADRAVVPWWVPNAFTAHHGPPDLGPPQDDGVFGPLALPDVPPAHHGPGIPGPNPVHFEALRALLSMLAWAGIYFGIAYGDELRASEVDRARLDAAVRDAQLRALQNQLNPHFLFNGLNTIRALIDEDAGKARRVVTRFSELLRSLLRTGQNDLVPLRQELATVEAYLEIEKCRYDDRLRLDWSVDPTTLDALVPPFLIQNLVENAVKHGTVMQPGNGTLSCQAGWEGDRLLVVVRNPGTLGRGVPGEGTGLANARTRLQLLFGTAASLELRGTAGAVVVELRVPRVMNL